MGRPPARKACGEWFSETDLVRFRENLLTWYDQHHRPLPWRTHPSLYATVVSEFMCQQTQVKTVLPYFERWMAALPDFHSLAAAPQERVLKLWEGLGYYTRARNLQQLARDLVRLGDPPRTAGAWRSLPGVGPYTAAAVASLAFDDPAPVIDGNVVRVLARLTADAEPIAGAAEAQRRFTPLASDLLDVKHPGRWNQAVMELGALVCTKARPHCLLCPLRGFCRAASRGDPEAYPDLVRRAPTDLQVRRLWIEDAAGRLLLQQATPRSRRLAGLWELPLADDLPRAIAGPELFVKRRTIGTQRLTESVQRAELPAPAQLGPHLAWTSSEDRASLTLSGPHKRWIAEWLNGGASR